MRDTEYTHAWGGTAVPALEPEPELPLPAPAPALAPPPDGMCKNRVIVIGRMDGFTKRARNEGKVMVVSDRIRVYAGQ